MFTVWRYRLPASARQAYVVGEQRAARQVHALVVHVFIFNNRIEIQNPGRLPGHITPENIFEERFARNPTIVRMLNKYPDAPNKDIGEGLNTALQKMQEVRLKPPKIEVRGQAVVVILPHEPLAAPADTVMEYLTSSEEVELSIKVQFENTLMQKSRFYAARESILSR